MVTYEYITSNKTDLLGQRMVQDNHEDPFVDNFLILFQYYYNSCPDLQYSSISSISPSPTTNMADIILCVTFI